MISRRPHRAATDSRSTRVEWMTRLMRAASGFSRRRASRCTAPRSQAERALKALIEAGELRGPVQVEGQAGEWYVLAGLIR